MGENGVLWALFGPGRAFWKEMNHLLMDVISTGAIEVWRAIIDSCRRHT